MRAINNQNNYPKALELFLCQLVCKYNCLNSFTKLYVASDIAYDIKFDIEESSFNTIKKDTPCYEEAYDDWYNGFAFNEILPLLLIHGAILGNEDEIDFIRAWTDRYCIPFMTEGVDATNGYDCSWTIFKSKTEDRFFLLDISKGDACFREVKLIKPDEKIVRGEI